jgi:cyclophilin family peptidyl-prolyl cis-trans isomerase
MSTKTIPIYIAIALLVAAGLWLAFRNKNTSNEVASNTQTISNQNTESTNSNTPPMNDNYDIKDKFVTLDVAGYGTIKIQLYDEDAPKTVENFLRLTEKGYYDGITFHRIAKNFVIQGGDPTGTGSGGESAFGGEFADELNPSTESFKAGYKKGVVAMANRGPNTNTSQFFIMLGDVDLPNNYTIFGKVVEGLEAVDKIGQAEITPQMGPTDGTPTQKIVITKATISSN